MKHLLALALLLSLSTIGMAQDNTETITIKTSIVCDHCMECDDCGFNIDTHIRSLKGIKKVAINPDDSTVDVTFRNDKTTPDEIRGAISNAGFDADDVKANPEAYAKLDGCCKKPEQLKHDLRLLTCLIFVFAPIFSSAQDWKIIGSDASELSVLKTALAEMKSISGDIEQQKSFAFLNNKLVSKGSPY